MKTMSTAAYLIFISIYMKEDFQFATYAAVAAMISKDLDTDAI